MQICTKTDGEALKLLKRSSKVAVLRTIKQSGLRGRGGAGFPAWMKIDAVMKAPGREKYLICNAEEGEPGTLKDGFIMEHNPQLLVEGMCIVARMINATKSYIYLNEKYKRLRPKLNREIRRLGADIEIRLSLQKYICGEETTLIEYMDSGRPVPRDRPPYPTTSGLRGMPTCVSNVETLSNIPLILTLKGWDRELQLFSITGDVQKHGVYEFRLGTRLRKILENSSPGGVKTPKFVSFGYAGGCLPYTRFRNMRVDHESVRKRGCELGARSIIVFGKDRSVPKTALRVAKFFGTEACGKCVPCRQGNYYFYLLMKRLNEGKCKKSDLKHLEEIAKCVQLTSFCGLGRAANTFFLTSLRHFRKEFERLCR